MGKKAPSKHSREARRATSPGIDLDKSLKNAKPPQTSVDFRPSILGIHQAAGVSKRVKKQGRKAVLSAKARRRQERGLDMAAAVMERTAQKVQRSKSSARTIQSRSKEWTEINKAAEREVGIAGKKKQQLGMFGALASGDDDDDDEDDGFEDVDSGDEAVRAFYGDDNEGLDANMDEATAAQSIPASVPLAALANDDDIL
ncbi:uncharacterized protein SPSK_04548 [Sporothrix schenckii 1099-18]|uniref:Ribosome biogenesis protein Alb1 n=1 Tax=Sporothrix schenckii 1099-18 TaxID=1397361 RepID=A0A0F2M2K2_SPOSC|nr:uncharacterized protein SPSK_04548 [Sporothrix schenckii 1099-18]KJR82965.1 hypothetical protein SPSK_04548 [Sporothrix schenckii 1099-18]